MFRKLTIISILALVGCTQPGVSGTSSSDSMATVQPLALPEGFSIVEVHPYGNFIRIASDGRADIAAISTIATHLSSTYDRIDLCLDIAHERGDEYLSIIGNKVFDYDNDNIFTFVEKK